MCKSNVFEFAQGTYIENCVENQCLFCNNKAIEGKEICQECEDVFKADEIYSQRIDG